MTRINVAPPRILTRQHLIAEYRELPRVFMLVYQEIKSGRTRSYPDTYCLGTGHVLFFYPKLGYLRDRHIAICDDMIDRGYVPKFMNVHTFWEQRIPESWWGNYVPTIEDIEVNLHRLQDRDPEAYTQYSATQLYKDMFCE